jgi:hypothetical protein
MTTTTPAAPPSPSPLLEDDVECLIKKPHWSRRLVIHIFRMALAMGLAFAISVFAVVLYVSDYKTKTNAPQPVVAPVVLEAPQEEAAHKQDGAATGTTTPPGETTKSVLHWIFGN